MNTVESENDNQVNSGMSWFRQRRRTVLIVLAGVITIILLSSTHVRIALSSAVFLNEVFPNAPVYPGRWVTSRPSRTLVQFRHQDDYHSAVYYQPGALVCGGGIVMYIGLGPQYGDPHLDRLARAFARNGYSVLIPVSEPMTEYRLSAEEHDIAVSAFRQLQRQPMVDPDRVGMFGISVGGAVVARAAQQPEIRDDVAMIHALGGFFDASQVLAQMSLRAYEVDGTWIDWEPSEATFRATRNSLVPLIPSEDRTAVWELFGSDTTEIPAGLTDEGEALARVLTNRDPEQVGELLDQLPPDVVRFLEAISPASNRDELQARTLLLHDRKDHVLPYSESVRFAENESEAGADVRLTLIDHFHHVRPDEDADIWSLSRDGFRLYRHIFAMHNAMDDRGIFTSPLDLLPFVDRSQSC